MWWTKTQELRQEWFWDQRGVLRQSLEWGGKGSKGGWSSGPRDPTHQRHPVPCSWWAEPGEAHRTARGQRTSMKASEAWCWGRSRLPLAPPPCAASQEEWNLSKHEFSILLVWDYDSVIATLRLGQFSWHSPWKSPARTGGNREGSRLVLTSALLLMKERWCEWLRVCMRVCTRGQEPMWSSEPACHVVVNLPPSWPGSQELSSPCPPLCPQGFECCQTPIKHLRNIYWIHESRKAGREFFSESI